MSLQDWIYRLSGTASGRPDTAAPGGSDGEGSIVSRLWGGTRGEILPKRKPAPPRLTAQERELEVLRRELRASQQDRSRLDSSLRMLETALETMTMGVTITDREGRIVYVNPADAKMHGYSVSELIGREAKVYSAATAPVTQAAPVEVGPPDPRHPWSRERIDATKDGRTFPVRLISERVRDGDQEPVATVTICEDLEERESIKEALARRERILEVLALAAEKLLSDAPWEQSVEEILERLGRATGVDLIYILQVREAPAFNPKSVILGWATPGGAAEKAFSEGLGLPDREDLFSRWHDRLEAGEILYGRVPDLPESEREILRPWGVHAFVVVPIFVDSVLRGFMSLEDGNLERHWSPTELEALRTVCRTLAAAIQRNEAETALADSEAKYRDLLENANDLIQSVSPDGRFHFVNRAWQEALGYGDDEVPDLRVWDVARGASEDEGDGHSQDTVERILSGGGGEGRLEAVFVTKDGREIPVEGSVNCRYVDGLPVAARGIFRDITERKIFDRMTQEFISTVSHELRTPLTSIIASLGLLESGMLASKPERSKELVSVALRNSNRLLQLINNLLDLQKLSARKMNFRLQPVVIDSLLVEAIEDIRAFADSYSIGLDLADVDPELVASGDRDRLMQVLNNLLSNAIKFSPDGEAVRVSAWATEEHVVLSVADRGPGIPEEFRSRLFDKFTQFDSSSTRRSGGSGLGLSIVKGMVEGMDGHIELDTAVDVGTTFHVYLPLGGLEPDDDDGPVAD